MAVGLMVASVFAAEAEDGTGGAAKNEARLLVGKHVRFLIRFLSLLEDLLIQILNYTSISCLQEWTYKLQRKDHLIKQGSN